MILEINRKSYKVSKNEFLEHKIEKYCNLKIYPKVGYYERVCSLLNEITTLNINDLLFINPSHGGFVVIECSAHFKNIYILDCSDENKNNIKENIKTQNIHNIFFLKELNNQFDLCFSENSFYDFNSNNIPKILLAHSDNNNINNDVAYKHKYNLSETDLTLCVNENYYDNFLKEFHYFLDKEHSNDNILNYDNAIHLCIMVKNGGEQFKTMLEENLSIIDRWTILDTGSTDNTIKYINEVLVGKKKGQLFQEPFIDFGKSRNRCLDLAGKVCKYTLMLDDTYIIRKKLRYFVNQIRGDQISNSFSLYIKSDDMEYVSNRLVDTNANLRYLFKIHEVITPENNFCVIIPIDDSFIEDTRHEYMEKRTMNRKHSDLKLLLEEIEEEPFNPRHYYYVAQTYNLLHNDEKALEYFLKRVYLPNEGFIQEKFDACFEAARISQYKLNKSWEECEKLYRLSIEISESKRPEPYYFIAIYYLMNCNPYEAYKYFKKAFEIGYPLYLQYSLKPTLSYYFLPKFLVELCYKFDNYDLGIKCYELFILNNPNNTDDYVIMLNWYKIFVMLKRISLKEPKLHEKPYLCFVADGGWGPWTGSHILTQGVGGSETYIIEMARYVQKQGYFNVVVFCNCPNEETFEDVKYLHLNDYYNFIGENLVHTSIISRYTEYLAVTYKSHVENVYLVLHDLAQNNSILLLDKKLKQIFCLTEWHVQQCNRTYNQIEHLTKPLYYGIDFKNFNNSEIVEKKKYKFIYSSFPNRGLLPLLLIWPHIVKKFPSASLYIYCDINGEWVNR